MCPVGGVIKPKNEVNAEIVEQERARIRLRQEARDPIAPTKAKVIWIADAGILIAVCVVLMALLMSK